MANYDERLQELRTTIDTLDQSLLDILKTRMDTAQNVGELKMEFNQPVLQPGRWLAMKDHLTTRAEEMGLEPVLVLEIFESIHRSSVRLQESLTKKN